MSDNPLDRSTIVALLEDLIRIPSVNPTLAPQESEGEAELAEFARAWMHDRGVDARLDEVAPGRLNVVAEVGAGAGPTLVICGHLDTVSAQGMTIPPFEPRQEAGRLYGRGSYDMKSGVAAAMAAAVALADVALPGRVILALVVDEEHASIGADHFVAHHQADACIVTEPTEGRLVLKHKGFVWTEITTHGVAAHGSRPDLGVSAITKMGPIIQALTRFDREELGKRSDPDLGPASLHPALIEGGIGISTYATECRMKVERRTLPGETASSVSRELETLIEAVDGTAHVHTFFHRSPLLCKPDATIAQSLRQAARSVTDVAPDETGVAFWTDAAIFQAAGIPAVNFGPGGEGAHAAVEWVDIDSVASCAQVLVETGRQFCTRG